MYFFCAGPYSSCSEGSWICWRVAFFLLSWGVRDVGVKIKVTYPAVYRVALHQPSGISLVGQKCTADVQVMPYRTITLVLVPVDTID